MRIFLAILTSLLFLSSEKIATTTEIPIQNGIWNGHYVSYYHNGNKKAEGDFKNNQRIGKWIVWDSLGQKQVERFYRNNFDCDIIKGKLENSANDKAILKYMPAYNKEGYIDYFPLKEKEIMCTKRVWRDLTISNNISIDVNKLWDTLYENILSGKLSCYKDDEFRTEIGELNSKHVADSMGLQITGYRLKEDWLYDSERKISETRVIGICPMGKIRSSVESRELCWIYLPQIRKYLSKFILNDKNLPPNVKTMDDLFFFRYFSSTIYKQTNLNDQELRDYCKTPEEIKKENIRIENEMLDMEHNVWMDEKYYARPKK